MARVHSNIRSGEPSSSAAGERPVFVRCNGCRRIVRKGDPQPPCPQCGAGTEREPWPLAAGRRLLNEVEEFYGRGDRELTVILACDFLEMLLEMFFRDLFVKQRRPPSWIRLTLRRNKSLDLRLRYLFKETLHVRFPSVIQGTPFEGFDRRWAATRSARVVLLDVNPPGIDDRIAREAFDLSRDGTALFAWLTNRYCA